MVSERTCQGEGRRGPCQRRPPDGEDYCAFHRPSEGGGEVVELQAASQPDSRDRLVSTALSETLANLDLQEADGAAVRLAERFADAIDSSDDPDDALATFGPKLRLVLESLGATPRGRAALTNGEKGQDGGSGRLAGLRAARSS